MTRKSKAPLKVGLLGLGVVGGGVVRVLQEKPQKVAQQAGRPIEIVMVLVRDPHKQRSVGLPGSLLTTRAEDILEDPSVDVVVELIGGEEPALSYIRSALERGKHVVTANKEVMAKHGPELVALARDKGLGLMFEASVGGGIPLIAPFKYDLAANDIRSIQAIINGTTNYILTKMAQEGLDFGSALREAQALGYAEADPRYDVEGLDAAYKIAILASLAFKVAVHPDQVYREGIAALSQRDFRYAAELGYVIKLLAIAKHEDGGVLARVHPTMIPAAWPLARVDGVNNAVSVEGDLVGRVLFYGRGAGSLPTASAVVADIMALAKGLWGEVVGWERGTGGVRPMDVVRSKYYLRLEVVDRPGVLAQITRVFGDAQISIASCIQKDLDEEAQTATIVVMTHKAQEKAMQRALAEIKCLAVVREVGGFIRVEE